MLWIRGVYNNTLYFVILSNCLLIAPYNSVIVIIKYPIMPFITVKLSQRMASIYDADRVGNIQQDTNESADLCNLIDNIENGNLKHEAPFETLKSLKSCIDAYNKKYKSEIGFLDVLSQQSYDSFVVPLKRLSSGKFYQQPYFRMILATGFTAMVAPTVTALVTDSPELIGNVPFELILALTLAAVLTGIIVQSLDDSRAKQDLDQKVDKAISDSTKCDIKSDGTDIVDMYAPSHSDKKRRKESDTSISSQVTEESVAQSEEVAQASPREVAEESSKASSLESSLPIHNHPPRITGSVSVTPAMVNRLNNIKFRGNPKR